MRTRSTTTTPTSSSGTCGSTISTPWNTTTLTWNNQPRYYLGGRDFITPPVDNPVDFDVTIIVADWANPQGVPNYGFLLADENDYMWPILNKNRTTTFYSRTTTDPPRLIIEYEAPDPAQVSVWADSEQIAQGQSTTVRWSSSGVSTCSGDHWPSGGLATTWNISGTSGSRACAG